MGIRARVFFTTMVVAIALLAMSFGVLYFSASAGLRRLETVDIDDALHRATAAVDEKVADLDRFALDWSEWDPLLRFTEDSSTVPGFVSENMVSPQSMEKLGVDVFIVVDAKGRVIYSEAVDPASLESAAVPREALTYAVRRAVSAAGQIEGASIKGLMATEAGPMMVVAQPIVHSSGHGPVVGTLLFGRFFDADDTAAIGKLTQMPVAFYSANRSIPASGIAGVRSALASGASPVVRDTDPTHVSGFETLSGVGGDAAILQVTVPRSALAVALDTSLSTGLWMLLGIGVVTGTLYLALDRTVIRRLSKLSEEVSSVADSGDPSRRVTPFGRDEIGSLSKEINVMLDTVESSNESLRESNVKLERMVYDVAESMGRVVEARDPYTQGHQERVAHLSAQIAREMGLSDGQAACVEFAGIVHDIGKLGVPAEVLSKPGKISAVEFRLIQEHSLRGHAILSGIDFPWPVADIVLQHHERMDGSGYPAGLRDGEIMLEARIIAVADVLEAMASHRPYRPALGTDAALEYLRSEPEKFDPDVLAACIRLWERGELDL